MVTRMYRFPTSIRRNGPITITAICWMGDQLGIALSVLEIAPLAICSKRTLCIFSTNSLHRYYIESNKTSPRSQRTSMYLPQHLLNFTLRNNNLLPENPTVPNNYSIRHSLQKFHAILVGLIQLILLPKSVIHLRLFFDLQLTVSDSTYQGLLYEFVCIQVFQGLSLLFSYNACSLQYRVFLTTYRRWHVGLFFDVQYWTGIFAVVATSEQLAHWDF